MAGRRLDFCWTSMKFRLSLLCIEFIWFLMPSWTLSFVKDYNVLILYTEVESNARIVLNHLLLIASHTSDFCSCVLPNLQCLDQVILFRNNIEFFFFEIVWNIWLIIVPNSVCLINHMGLLNIHLIYQLGSARIDSFNLQTGNHYS